MAADVQRLAITHHDPMQTDENVDVKKFNTVETVLLRLATPE